MSMKTKLFISTALLGIAVFYTTARAAQKNAEPAKKIAPKFLTTIQIKDIHCKLCAMKITKQLTKLKAVKSAKADIKKGIVTVVPKDVRKPPTPRSQWETVEKSGYTPVKLKGPFGTFTSKPKSKGLLGSLSSKATLGGLK